MSVFLPTQFLLANRVSALLFQMGFVFVYISPALCVQCARWLWKIGLWRCGIKGKNKQGLKTVVLDLAGKFGFILTI